MLLFFWGCLYALAKGLCIFHPTTMSEEGGLAVKTNAGDEGEGGVIRVLGGGGGCETDCTERVDAKVLT